MSYEEIIKEIEHLEQRLVKADIYFKGLDDEKIEHIEDTREYIILKGILQRLNSLYNTLENLKK